MSLGSCTLPLYMLSPYHCDYCSLLMWRTGIWGDGLELRSVDSDSLGLCSVDSESLW
jgi:hypothetical protein